MVTTLVIFEIPVLSVYLFARRGFNLNLQMSRYSKHILERAIFVRSEGAFKSPLFHFLAIFSFYCGEMACKIRPSVQQIKEVELRTAAS